MTSTLRPQCPRLSSVTLAVAFAFGLAAGWSPQVHAQSGVAAASPALAIDIPAQPLGSALNALARQSNLKLTFAADAVAGKSAPAVVGQMTVQQALDRLLVQSGLQASVDGQVVLVKKATAVAPVVQQPADEASLSAVVITELRSNRVSVGATGLAMDIKETPQSISTLQTQEMREFGVTDGNKALQLATGLNVEQYETNRATFNSRGFEIQSTQIDGLGMTNSWGTVVGQQDTFLFDKIEVIRGANGLLTGVGNSSGTINYVRKRPTNKDEGEINVKAGAHGMKRLALDYNKVLVEDGSVAGRLVLVHQDSDSHIRNLNDNNTSLYGVIDSQIGRNGVLTLGLTHQDNKQKSPMWGSLTLNYLNGGYAEFDTSSSTSQDWTYWNTKSTSVFAEYTHYLSDDWVGKFTFNNRHAVEQTKLLYAYATAGGLNDDRTGLYGWPYRSYMTTDHKLLDANISGKFELLGRKSELVAGLSHSDEETATDTYSYDPSFLLQPMPAFPFGGNAYPEPVWGERAPTSSGSQTLTRFYAASRIPVTDKLRAIFGLNSVKLARQGNAIYGAVTTPTEYPDTRKTSPYGGITYDFTPTVLGYASYSQIFQNQDQKDFNGNYVAPMKGVNHEVGVKVDWLDKRLLTTFAVFGAMQEGLATYAGMNGSQYYYEPKDVKSRGVEFEAVGKLSSDTRLSVGLTHLKLTGPDGNDIYEWVPRTTAKLRLDSRVAALPDLRLGVATRWQSDVRKDGGARQSAYMVSDAFLSYRINKDLTARLNINNLFNKKYVTGIAYGAIYGEPRSAYVSLEHKL